MQSNTQPIMTDLVLIGGGHSHGIALLMWGMNPIPGVRLTLITDTSHTPYSGMLPGHVAGFYSYDDTHIDLRRLASFTKAQFYLDQAVGLDLKQNKVLCRDHPPVAFDYLSLDIGSTPTTSKVKGAAEYAIPAKPVPQFLQEWNEIVKTAQQYPDRPLRLAIVGGGAGGVELALNMQQRLRHLNHLQIHLFHRGSQLLSLHNDWVRNRLKTILLDRKIHLHLAESVQEVHPHQVICESGLTVKCDRLFWVTQASAPSWIEASGITTDSQGFLLVEDTLQSVSHPHIFAAGDIATMKNHPRPKAGVFAVRQGKPLFENLQRIILGQPLQDYIPQKRYLGLIGTGDQKAIASWSSFGWQSPLLWRWKDHIDRKFMRRFSDLPAMDRTFRRNPDLKGKDTGIDQNKTVGNVTSLPRSQYQTSSMHCGGCGSKVGSSVLENVLPRLPLSENSDVLVGLNSPDDAAIIKVSGEQLRVHTIDYFPSLLNDPFIFGQITANHCLSDLFAMGATPQTALAIATLPYGKESKQEEILYQLLSGVTQALEAAQASLIGGHTTEGNDLALGLSCQGYVSPDHLLRKGGMNVGEVLILTKGIGTGTLFAADRQYQAKGRWIDNAIESMLLSNQKAAQILLKYQASACTDITGFGLLGHLGEMLKASQVQAQLHLEAIPTLQGAVMVVEQGIFSSLYPQNFKASDHLINEISIKNTPPYSLLFDPQTSGGLLASIPSEQATSCLQALHQSGYYQSSIIGRLLPLKQRKDWITF